MECAIYTIATGMQAMANANRGAEYSVTEEIISYTPIMVDATEAGLTAMNAAHWNYFCAVENISSNPSEAATAVADYGIYEGDSAQFQKCTQFQNSTLQEAKSELTTLENSSPYKIMASFDGFERNINSLITMPI